MKKKYRIRGIECELDMLSPLQLLIEKRSATLLLECKHGHSHGMFVGFDGPVHRAMRPAEIPDVVFYYPMERCRVLVPFENIVCYSRLDF